MSPEIKDIRITEKEEALINEVLDGSDLLAAFKKVYGYSDKHKDGFLRYEAKKILSKDRVQKAMEYIMLERMSSIKVDEAFIIEQLKKIVLNKAGTNQAVRALELLGKYKGMWIDKQVVEDNTSQRDVAELVWKKRVAKNTGDDIEAIEEQLKQMSEKRNEDNVKADVKIIEFESGVDDGTEERDVRIS